MVVKSGSEINAGVKIGDVDHEKREEEEEEEEEVEEEQEEEEKEGEESTITRPVSFSRI